MLKSDKTDNFLNNTSRIKEVLIPLYLRQHTKNIHEAGHKVGADFQSMSPERGSDYAFPFSAIDAFRSP